MSNIENYRDEYNGTITRAAHADAFTEGFLDGTLNDKSITLLHNTTPVPIQGSYCKSIIPQCATSEEIPCVPGYNRCFPLNMICVFDLDDNGDILYCPGGEHLDECKLFKCLGMFKCSGKINFIDITFHVDRLCD